MWLLRHAQFHGAVRLADSRHRSWWVVALVLLLLASAGILREVLERFFDSPTVLVKLRSDGQTNPFPSVILCPEIDFPAHKIENFLNEIDIPPSFNRSILEEEIQQLAAYYASDVRYDTQHLDMIQYVLDYNSVNVEDAVKRLSKNCSETLIRCGWQGEIVDCSSLFRMEVTGVGFCCVFNGRSLRREIKEFGIQKVYPTARPRIATMAVGPLSGLAVAVEQTQLPFNIDLSYKWFAMQSGDAFVDIGLNGTPLSPRSEHWFGYYESRLTLSEQARGWSRDLLRCRTRDDALKYFPIYSWRYCLVECEIAQTLRKCGCLRPVHPQLPGVRQCPADRLECSRHAAVSVGSSDDCNCPQACEMENGQVAAQSLRLASHVPTFDPLYEGLDMEKVTIIRAYVLNYQTKTFNRRPMYTSLDLFSNLGGIFNVYLGCSVLTVLELFLLLVHCAKSGAISLNAHVYKAKQHNKM